MIALFVAAFGRPDLLREQKRLLDKNLHDPFTLTVLDNTPDRDGQRGMRQTCSDLEIRYIPVVSKTHEHPEALNLAARLAHDAQADLWGTLDHDIFPSAPTTLIDQIREVGFHGMGQTYTPRCGQSLRYLWPGWCFFSRVWLGGRIPDFNGIRGQFKFDDGDCGSMMHPLFSEADWARMPVGSHEYGLLRPEDGHGLQSFGFEVMSGGWLHFTNASNWKAVPDPGERDELIRERLAAL